MPGPTGDTHKLLIERVGGAGIVTLNRPEVRNALDAELRHAVPAALRELDTDDSVRVLVLTGTDPAFCAGLDLAELGSQGLGDGGAERVSGHALPFGALTKPLIGAINGVAVTGGLEYALGCDFLIASDRARFADTHARVGVMPGWGLTVLLPQAIGRRRAHQMSFTGNYCDAETALAWGLVNEVVPHASLRDRVLELAADMASVPVAHLCAIKAAYNAANDEVDVAALDAEAAFSRDWARSFDPASFAERRSSIEDRGRSQT